MRVLVDTSVWSLALRRPPEKRNVHQAFLVDRLTELVREGRISIIGPIRQELLSGIREHGVFETIREVLRVFDDEPIETFDYEEAARFENVCRAEGLAGSPVDFLICAVAHRHRMDIFTTDGDFARFARHLDLKLFDPAPPK